MNDNKTYPHTQTFLIEASRGDSLIDNKDNNDFNSKWTTETNIVLKRGDTVSCEMVSLNAQNAGSSASIEFSGENVIIDGEKKDYCDNKVLLEVFFYLNNNNTYSVGLPLKHPNGSFDDTTFPQQRYQPITGGNNGVGGGLAKNNQRGLVGTPNTISYATLDVTSGLSPTLTGQKAHYIVAWQKTDNTWVTTLPSATKIKAFVLGNTTDNTAGFNPQNGRSCNHTDWLSGKVGTNITCNLLEGQSLVTQDDGGILIPDQNRIILGIIKQPLTIPTLTGTDRLQISANPETFWTSVQPCSQGAFFGALPYTDNYGTSEIGLINYDNLDPASYVTQPPMCAKNSNLSNYMQNIGRHFPPASPQFEIFANSVYGDAAKPQEISVAQSVYDNTNTQSGDPGFRCQNPRMENNSKPYILTRNDWCGQGRRQQNDCRKFLPKLEPLSAFILLEADELFTDVNSLAQKINDKLHETLNLFDTDIQEQDNYLSNQLQYENITAKASSVLPLAQTAGYIDPALGTGVTENYAFYDTIVPIKCGGTVKIQPANFDDGINYFASGSVAYVDKLTEYFSKTTYINKCPLMSINPEKIENPIYGNCGYINFFKQQMGDRWARLPLKDMNTINSRGALPEGGLRYMSKCCILNNKLKYQTVDVESTTIVSTVATELLKNQLIFTNIYYPTISVDKTQQAEEEQKWEDYAKEVRKYELYSNNTDSALRDYDLQDQTIDWVIDMDLGITDDNKTDFLASAPAGTSRFEPIQFDWTTQYPSVADSTADPANGTSADLAGATRPLINPIFSNPAFGTTNIFDYNKQYAQYRPLGSILIESRYDKNYINSSKTITDQDPGVVDAICELLDSSDKNASPTQPLNNTLIERLNLGIYPYEYTDEDGNKSVLCAIRTGKAYQPTLAEGGDYLELQLASITWGLPIGVSPASLDNHMICPMNADFRKTTLASPNRGLIYNRINQIWVGANNPTFQFNSDKNRYEFINLQTDQLLSSFNSVSGATPTTAVPAVPSQLGQKVGIIDRDPLDAKFSSGGKKSKIKGIRDTLGGVGVYNVWLCPPDYIPPSTISLSNYWDNSTTTATQENHDKITAGCVEASRENWEGCLLDRCGFDYFSLFPKYGRQYNRFDPVTYNNDNPRLIGTGTKPLLLGNRLNNVNNPSLSLYYSPVTPVATDPVLGQPNFGLSFPNGQPVLIENDSQQLTATSSPILTTSPFYIIYSDIVGERNYQSGSTPLPALFYCMRNYSNSGFFYGYGSTFSIMINQDRVLSLINTEIRNPNGELAKLSKNSTIMYKIQRQAVMPAPTIDVFGQIENQQQPDPNQEELLEILNNTNNIASSIAGGTGARIKKSGSNPTANIIKVPSRGVARNSALPSSVAGTQTQGTQLSTSSSQTGTSSGSGSGETKTQSNTFTEADALSQTNVAQGIEQFQIGTQTREGVLSFTGTNITPETLGISELDRKLVDVILRSILAKLPAQWTTAQEYPEELMDDPFEADDFFPTSKTKTRDIKKLFTKAIKQVFSKLNLDELLLSAQNNPDQLVSSLLQPANPENNTPAGVLAGIRINSNGQVTYNINEEDPTDNQSPFTFNVIDTNFTNDYSELINFIIGQGSRPYNSTDLKTMRGMIEKSLEANEIVGDWSPVPEPGEEQERFIYTDLNNLSNAGTASTYAGGVFMDGEADGFVVPPLAEVTDQLGELNFIFASQDGRVPELEDLLNDLNQNLKPRILSTAQEDQAQLDKQMEAVRRMEREREDASFADRSTERVPRGDTRGEQKSGGRQDPEAMLPPDRGAERVPRGDTRGEPKDPPPPPPDDKGEKK